MEVSGNFNYFYFVSTCYLKLISLLLNNYLIGFIFSFRTAPVLLGRSIAESALSSPTEIDPSERLSITSEMVDVKKRPTFIPDYSVKVVSDVYFLRIKFEQYHHARAATEMEKVYEAGSGSGGELQDKINKVRIRIRQLHMKEFSP